MKEVYNLLSANLNFEVDKMYTETNVSAFPVVSGALLQGVHVTSIVGNVLIITIIAKTPGLKGFTGLMLLNHAFADILSEIFSLCVFIDFLVNGKNFYLQIILRLGLFVVNGVVAHTLSALSVNLHFAICHPHSFKKNSVNWSGVSAFICVSWLNNIGIVSLYCLVPAIYLMKPTGDILMNVTLKNCWFMGLLITNMILFPFCSALVCFFRIHNFTRVPSIATIGAKHARKLKLAKMIQVTTMAFLLTYIPLVVDLSLGVDTKGGRACAAFVNYSFHACKIFIYLKCYKPFRETCKVICCYKRRVNPGIRMNEKHMISVLPAANTSF